MFTNERSGFVTNEMNNISSIITSGPASLSAYGWITFAVIAIGYVNYRLLLPHEVVQRA